MTILIQILLLIAIAVLAWSVLLVFKIKFPHACAVLEHKYGIHIVLYQIPPLFHIQFITTKLNPIFEFVYLKSARSASPTSTAVESGGNKALLSSLHLYLKAFYNTGATFCFIGACFAVVILFLNVSRFILPALTSHAGTETDQSPQQPTSTYEGLTQTVVLKPLIPGINVPFSQCIYIFLALVVSAVVHEIGHGIAAASEGLTTSECGIFCFLFLPGAYVKIHPPAAGARVDDGHHHHHHRNSLAAVSTMNNNNNGGVPLGMEDDDAGIDSLFPYSRQLRIYCAGAWHNIMLCIAAAALLYLLPILLSPAYAYHGGTGSGGAFVKTIAQACDSPLYIHPDLRSGAELVSVNDCEISSGTRSWEDCWVKIYKEYQQDGIATGYCVSENKIRNEYQKSGVGCCNIDADADADPMTQYLMCFAYVDPYEPGSTTTTTTTATITTTTTETNDPVSRRMCAKASEVSRNAICRSNLDCMPPDKVYGGEGGTTTGVCVKPTSPIFKIRYKASSGDNDAVREALLTGSIMKTYETVEVTDYRARWLVSWLLGPSIPGCLSKFLNYVLLLSAALAILNMAPVFFLDGEKALRSLLLMIQQQRRRQRQDTQQRYGTSSRYQQQQRQMHGWSPPPPPPITTTGGATSALAPAPAHAPAPAPAHAYAYAPLSRGYARLYSCIVYTCTFLLSVTVAMSFWNELVANRLGA